MKKTILFDGKETYYYTWKSIIKSHELDFDLDTMTLIKDDYKNSETSNIPNYMNVYKYQSAPTYLAVMEFIEVSNERVLLRLKRVKLSLDNSSEYQIKKPYSPSMDKYLEILPKEQSITIYQLGKKSKKICYESKCHSLPLYSIYDIVIKAKLFGRFSTAVIVKDDFFEPIKKLYQYPEFKYIEEMQHDDALKNALFYNECASNLYTIMDNSKKEVMSTLLAYRYGLKYDRPFCSYVEQCKSIIYNLASWTANENKGLLYQLSYLIFYLLNPGVEAVYKSDFKTSLVKEILHREKTYPVNSIVQSYKTDKTTLKAIRYFLDKFADKACNTTIKNYDMKILNKISDDIMCRQNIKLFEVLLERLNGYNNLINFIDLYFEEYYPYTFLMTTIENSTDYYVYRKYRENKEFKESIIFEETLNKIASNFLRLCGDLCEFLYDAPEYKNNLHRFYQYLFQECRKQGFTSLLTMLPLFRDYISMQKKMGAQHEKYPKHLHTAHDIAVINYTVSKNNQKVDTNGFNNAVSSYENLQFHDRNYTIITPNSYSELFIEGASLNHCVASYVSKVINKQCKILFLRERKNVNSPYYTICIEKNRITQVKGLNQKDPDTEELKDFISNWAVTNALLERYC